MQGFTKQQLCGYLSQILSGEKFVQRGDAFFRINDGKVLQTVRFTYEHVFNHFELNIGIRSMYSELSPKHFTANHCVCPYSVLSLVGQKSAVVVTETDGLTTFDVVPPDTQIDILEKHGVKLLNAVNTQAQLIQALMYMDNQSFGEINWNDSGKIAPFLAVGDFSSADRVIGSILHQHVGPDAWTSLPWNSNDFIRYISRYSDEDTEFLRIHNWICEKDAKRIQEYLQTNYSQNIKWGKFCVVP